MLKLLALLVLCAGCRGDGAEQTGGRKELRLFIMFISTQQAEFFRWAEETYEAAHPDVDIIVEQFPGSSLKDFEIKLRLRFSSRQEPDLMMSADNIMAPFARLGLLNEAPEYIKRMVEENSLNEMIRQAPYVDGKLYGIATDAAWQALYYNKAMFREVGLDPERPPKTWAELIDYADRLTIRRPDGSPIRAGFSVRKTGYKIGTADKWYTFLYSAGGTPYSEDGTQALFNSPAGREALELYRTLLFERNIDSVTHEGDQQGFGQGRVAMFYREIHVDRWLKENYPDIEFGVAPIPAEDTSISSGGTYFYAVSEATPNKEEAWRFVQFLMQDEAYGRYVSIGGIIPTMKSIASRPPFSTDPVMQVYLNQEARNPGSFPMLARATEVMGAYIERFCYGLIGADELLERAERDVNAVLARNRLREQREETASVPADNGGAQGTIHP